jgi:uncharacterized protein
MELPRFRYHPDPVSTGYVEPSGRCCSICDTQRGFVYTGPSYGTHDQEAVFCPWCIASGDAAKRLDLIFTDPHPLKSSGVKDAIIDEITLRTPGFTTWQDPVWMCHCGDACEFHGDLTAAEAQTPDATALAAMLAETRAPSGWWEDFITAYQPGGNPAIYKFVCRHCSLVLYEMDFT